MVDLQDIRTVFKTGMQIRYRATEQKQNQVQWRAIAVCSKNASIDVLTGRQPKSIDAVIGNRFVVSHFSWDYTRLEAQIFIVF